MAIKAVIFDLGRVIVPFDFNRGYTRLEPLCGIPAAEIPKRIAPTGLVPLFESGGIEPRDFVRELSRHLNLDTSYENFCEIWSSIFLPHTLIPESMLAGVARNYRLVLLSNTNAIHFEMVRENYPLLRHFHSFVLSYEVGAMKPLPQIYRRAIEEAGCLPEECFFTDDIPDYVAGARAQGIDAVQFESAEQIEAELRKRGVNW
ncbi:MAG TPA: HAD family phosphatase [Bryobacteraceae bacterium]|jgi:putative hydrolase of the HAD superfamily|nr:HAD family phosphatase [Bryobacteraceae bacterium]